MKKLSGILITLLLISAQASATDVRTVSSPPGRVAVLELYTSEGCSSCPPADRWLSALRKTGISEDQLIPLAFHVTYWDYIGWKDSFAKPGYDERQRKHGRNNKLSTIYTPQFVLDGNDFRRYNQFSEDVHAINKQKASVDLKLALSQPDDRADDRVIDISLSAEIKPAAVADVALYLAIVESGLSTAVEDGENEGETLRHDYVVRELLGPVYASRPESKKIFEQQVKLRSEWLREAMNVVGFAQNPHTGEVLQAVSIKLAP